MPRKPSPPRSHKSKQQARGNTSSALATVRATLGKLRDLAFGLGLISAVSFVPQSMVQQWPTHARTAMGIAVDIRSLLVDVGRDTANGIGSLVEDLDPPALGDMAAWLPTDLPDWVPWGGVEPVPPGHTPRTAGSFGTAKNQLYNRIYRGHRKTFYCGCDYDSGERTSLGSCGLESYAGQTRADRVEVEHVFPASQFGNYRKCWRNPASFPECRQADGDVISGRDCCQRVDQVFTAAHNDLHNLVPAVGLINGQRSNHNWGMVSGGERYGTCTIRIDSSIRRVQPPDAVRGDIARIMLYMQDTYGFRLSRQDQQLYAAWNNIDPPDAWEIERDRRIAKLQGKGNEYVSSYRRL